MLRNILIKTLLFPLSILYGLGVWIRNTLYDRGLLRSISFDLPVISVGNLSVGGAGKTPHIEYLILLLRDYIQVATLSRGYKRKTTGFLMVESNMSAESSGDEPLQFKRKFPEISVAVSESRELGIPRLLGLNPEIQTILLDDAFQHRSVSPGLNILLTEYGRPYTDDFLLPVGRLREMPSAAARADVIVATKCPVDPAQVDREDMLRKLKPQPHQQVFFSYYEYGQPYYMYNGSQRIQLDKSVQVLLISAIAGTEYLTTHVASLAGRVQALEFEDHHDFSRNDVGQMKKVFDNMPEGPKIILTTEKDAVRLDLHRAFLLQERMPVFVLPLRVRFHFGQGAAFDELVRSFLLEFQV